MKKLQEKTSLMRIWLENISVILAAVIIYDTMGMKGIIYALGLFVLFAIYRVWRHKDQIKSAIDTIGGILFGKPLKPEYWEKGELIKTTKVRFGLCQQKDKKQKQTGKQKKH